MSSHLSDDQLHLSYDQLHASFVAFMNRFGDYIPLSALDCQGLLSIFFDLKGPPECFCYSDKEDAFVKIVHMVLSLNGRVRFPPGPILDSVPKQIVDLVKKSHETVLTTYQMTVFAAYQNDTCASCPYPFRRPITRGFEPMIVSVSRQLFSEDDNKVHCLGSSSRQEDEDMATGHHLCIKPTTNKEEPIDLDLADEETTVFHPPSQEGHTYH